MRKILITILFITSCLSSTNLLAQFGGGTGAALNPYIISTVSQLNYFSSEINGANSGNYVGKYFKLTTNLSGINTFTPIGNSNTNSFRGYFDGDGHTISNLNINSGTYIGLFGYISNATIEKIGVIDGNMSPITNGYAGGLVGYAINSIISQCFSKVSLSVNNVSRSGGLIGNANNSIINNCFYTIGNINVNVNAPNVYIGGLIGYIENNSEISNCFSSPANFTNNNISGPLYGYCSSDSPINNCYYYDNWKNQTYGIPMNQQSDMATLDFAKKLNACQNQTWRKIPNNGSSTYYPTLYWQVPPDWLNGTEIFGCGLDGGGLPNDPFRIRNVKDLVILSGNVNKAVTTYLGQYLLVENNIDFNNDPIETPKFNPIGNSSTNSFQGNFNGGSHIISNLTITSNYSGLFGYVLGARIINLGIEGFVVNTKENYYGGGLIGYADKSKISECYAIASIEGDKECWLGGLIGSAINTEINNCYAKATLTNSNNGANGNRYYGGLVGYINASTIKNSYSVPSSFPKNGSIGSLVGRTINGSTLTNSYYDNKLSPTGYNNLGNPKSPSELMSGCFVVTLNNSQDPIVWYKAKSQVNSGYPVLSWQKLSDNITPAGFEGNCLSVSVNDGHQAMPYKIKYVKDLIYISNMVANDTNYNSKFFQMLNDINYNNGLVDSSSLYNQIGNYTNNKPFSGNFNGQRYAIANYSFSDATQDNIGLFGYTRNAIIQRLGISNINISARDNVGGLVAYADSLKIGGCFVYGYLKGRNNVGGLVGFGNAATASTTKIDTSFSNTTIDAISNVGGLAGKYNGTISNSYSNSEIYSSTNDNRYVGGIIGFACHSNSLDSLKNVYNVCKITRRGSNTNFGKITGNNNNFVITSNIFSRDSVFINCSNPSGKNGTPLQNSYLKSPFFVSDLGSNYWKADYSDLINDGYPILKYQLTPAKLTSSGNWKTASNWGGSIPNASQVAIIPSGKQLKIDSTSSPYIIIEKDGELYNNTDINLFGEKRRELVLGKWNFIGTTTNNPTMSFLYNYADTAYKTFVKQFNPNINNWDTTTIRNNTQLIYNTGYLVMPNYSLDAQQLTTSRIASKGVFYNTNTSTKTFTNGATKLVSLANNYNSNLSISQFLSDNSGKIQGGIVYSLNANSRDWNNNLNSTTLINKINPSEGFFVFASNANTSFTFSRSQLISSTKKVAFKELMYVKAKANDIIREAFIEFNEDAENGFDIEDGLMLFGTNEDIVEPYFKKEDNEILKDAFSSLPYSTELNLRSYSTNNVNLEFSNISKDIKVYLIDSLLKKIQELNSNPIYNLGITEGNNENRVKILFTNNEKDIVNYFNTDELDKIQIWNSNSIININGIGLNRFEVYDIMGQKILQQEITTDEFQSNLNLNSGIYIIRVYSKTSINSSKISICR